MSEFFERISKLSPKRLALLALELQERLEKAEAQTVEPIAVVGLGCRFPGQVTTPEKYWELLRDGIDAVTEVPPERWDAAALYDTDPNARGRSNSKWGGFLSGVDRFDAKFFGIARREAVSLDPQQRLLLEVTWEALEHAGIAPDSLNGTSSGVFVSIGGLDYYHLLTSAGLEQLDAYSVSGSAPSMAAGRLAYFLGLQGPALTVDTACSSSLVATHLACQSLRAGECRTALAGASSLILSPETTVGLSQAHMLSPRGRCRSFDAGADGFVRGEGCGVVVLKRLSDARADGDRILALIRGTAINQDGRSSGITAPNGPAQEAVIREALQRSRLTPADIDYVEAHGTGTPLGDPIEVRALANVFRGERETRLLIGSVKSNFGHLEMAAGVAGLMKIVLSLQHESIPPHLHVTQPSGYIDWEQTPLEITRSQRTWSRSNRVRRAAVSSFGFSGTNAHLVIEEAPEAAAVGSGVERPLHLLAFSARDEAALADLAAAHRRNLQRASVPLADICFTANAGRSHFGMRAAVIGESREDIQRALATFADPSTPSVWRGRVAENGRQPEVAFLFTGQGSQYPRMARELYETQPVFRRAFDDCEQRLNASLGLSLSAVCFAAGDDGSAKRILDDTTYTQPALFAIEYALAKLWQSWGVHPSVVAGHSVGEYVAACIAGVLNLDDALRLIALRGRLMGALPPGGGMASVFCEEATALRLLGRESESVSVAAVNGPAHIVLSGPERALDAVLERVQKEGIRSHRLQVSHAFHSNLIEPMLPAFEQEAARVTPDSPKITLISNLTGKPVSEAERLDGNYWRRHARGSVRFADSIRAVHAQGCRIILEIGPHPVLIGMGLECLPDADVLWLPSLRRGSADTREMLSSLARLYTAGLRIDWHAFDREFSRKKVDVPTYPFQRESYWLPQAPATSVAPARNEIWRDWLYSDEWKPLQTAGLISPTALVAATEAAAPGLTDKYGAQVYDLLYPALDALCSAYIQQAFDKLGWASLAGGSYISQQVREQLGILQAHQRLLERLLGILAEDGLLTRTGDAWQFGKVPSATDPAALAARLLQELPACSAEIKATRDCGEKLAQVLTGRQDPLEILFPGGSLEVAEALYEHAPSMRVFNNLVSDAVVAALQDRPSPRILEIGAGTGATTASVLPKLPGDAHYVFTDVSSAFTNRARVRFASFPNVEYTTLDLEADPGAQGFVAGQFDVVIASNVLHATARLDQSLAHVKSLLAPGGLLILVEAVGHQRFGDLTVGLTSGWWRFEDTELRPDYALLGPEEWKRALRDAGFEDNAVWPQPGLAAAGLRANMILIAARTAPGRVPAPAERPSWILFADRQGIAEQLAQQVRNRGDRCSVVGTHAELKLPRDIAMSPGAKVVVNCRPLDARFGSNASADDVMHAVESACGSTLALVKALAMESGASDIRLITLTQGVGESTLQEPGTAAQATLSGLGRTVWLEHPELRYTSVDLAATAGESDFAAIAGLLEDTGAERELTVRNGSFLRRMIVRASTAHESSAQSTIRPRASYLITGAFGGLGLCVSEWLANAGADHLILCGRRPNPGALSVIDRLRANGVQVQEIYADISRPEGVDQALAAAPADAPLAGVFHLAGSLNDGLLLEQDWSRFETVMAAKVRGAWLLHQRTAAIPLEHFVLFSSGASFAGSPGQANHASANAFMDALARLRHAAGLPGLSINWGAWKEIGAATKGAVLERARAHGLGAMSTADATAAFAHVMGSTAGQIAILPIEWAAFLRDRGPDPALAGFQKLAVSPAAPGQQAEATSASQETAVDPTAWLQNVPAAKLRDALERLVMRELSRALGMREADMDPGQPLRDAGLDSLMAVELRNALNRHTGLHLPAAALFNYPTVEELVNHLHSRLADEHKIPTLEPQQEESTAALDDLSEDELAVMLAGKLAAVGGGSNRGL